jgi:hypothetical protein
MKSIIPFLVFLFSAFTHASSFCQVNTADGFFTSEAKTVANKNIVFVSIKKYNPKQIEIDNARKPSRNSPMTYLMIPFEAISISLFNKEFESKLYALDTNGKVLWDKTIGYNNKSTPSPLKHYKANLYTGESAKDADKVTIQKLDLNGKMVWQTDIDSFINVNDLFIEDNIVYALVSFDHAEKIEHNDGTYSEKIYPVYYYVQLDITTGKFLSKEYQMMGNYLSGQNYSNAFFNSNYSYYLNNADSAIFLNTKEQKSAIVVSENMAKENRILNIAAYDESNHLLTSLSLKKNKKVYNLISDYYGKQKKYQNELPVEFNDSDRRFIFETIGDSIAVIIGNAKNIFITYTNIEGKTALVKKIDKVISPIVAVASFAGKIYILQMEGRTKLGTTGKLRIDCY